MSVICLHKRKVALRLPQLPGCLLPAGGRCRMGSNGKWDRELGVAVAAAKAAGAVIKAAFIEDKQVEHKKNASDLVTETDIKAEMVIMGMIKATFPTHQLIGEEGCSQADGHVAELTDEPTWMCDPLDGTTNFVHGFPFVCVSLGLVVNRQAVVGVVYNPVMNELFTATQGGGAFLNGQPIHCSGETQLSHALLATEIGTTRDTDTFARVFGRIQSLAQVMRSVRCGGSCALGLCGVACGRVDAFYEVGFGGCWDVAAGSLIASEAGASVLDPAGGRFGIMARRVLAASPALAQPIAAILEECGTSEHEPSPPGCKAAA